MPATERDLAIIILDLATEDATSLWELSPSVAEVIPDRALVPNALRQELLALASQGFVRIGFREHAIDCPKYLEAASVPAALEDAEYWMPAEASVVVVATKAGDVEYNRRLRERAETP
jgi:hypothetical protein